MATAAQIDNISVNNEEAVELTEYIDPTNGHAYVDLGLRKEISGITYKVCFATMNIGATSPEEFGDYFAWGETQKKYTDFNGNSVIGGTFSHTTCPYHSGNDEATGWTKYCNEQDNIWIDYTPEYPNVIDDKYVLDSLDDAASVLWGGKWKIPTADEFTILLLGPHEFISNYNNTGVSGLLCTGSGEYSSSTLFFPCAGRICDNNRSFNDSGYWSSSRYEQGYNASYCYLLHIETYDVSLDYYDYAKRWYGLAVRPVILLPE